MKGEEGSGGGYEYYGNGAGAVSQLSLSKDAINNQFTNRLVNVETIWVTNPCIRIDKRIKRKKNENFSHIP